MSVRVEDLVQQQFRENKIDGGLNVLSIKGITEAAKRCIDIKDQSALEQLYRCVLENSIKINITIRKLFLEHK